MTPFGVVLVTAVLSAQKNQFCAVRFNLRSNNLLNQTLKVMQIITQPKKYRCISLRPLPQPEPEPISPLILRLPPSFSIPNSPSTASKSSPSVSKSPSSVPKSPYSVSKSPSSVSKSPSLVTKTPFLVNKSPSTVPKSASLVTNSSRTSTRSSPDSFSLFRLPLKLISSLLLPLLPPTVRQNTSSIIAPIVNFQMPLTFSTIHQPNNLPCNTNNLPVPCSPGNTNSLPIPGSCLPGNTNTIPTPCNSQPGNTNTKPIPCNSVPCNTNTIPIPGSCLLGNTNTIPIPCNSQTGNTNTIPTPSNSVPVGNTNTLPNPCNSSVSSNTNKPPNGPCNYLPGNSHKLNIYNWFCNFFLNKIHNITGNILTTEVFPSTSTEPTPPVTYNHTVTPVPSGSPVVTPATNTPPTEDNPTDNTPTVNVPTSTPNNPITPCSLTPTHKIHKPCLPLIHHIPKPTPCGLPVAHLHPHIPFKFYPLNHAPCSSSHTHFSSLFDPTTNKLNADLTLNPQEEILLKIVKSLISTSNVTSPSTYK